MSDNHESLGALRPCACGYPDCPASAWTGHGHDVASRWMDPETRGRLLVRHLTPGGEECHANILVDTPYGRDLREREGPGPIWHAESLEPLTLSPSIACSCGAHGFIRNGKWVPA